MGLKNTLTKLAEFVIGQNVRLPRSMDIERLVPDIATNGLTNPIQGWHDPAAPGKVTVLRGHRRYAAISKIAEKYPDAFSKWFADGIPTLIHTNITAMEAMVLKVDHGNESPLTDIFEIQLCANMLFSAGKTEDEVILSLAGLMDVVSPMKVAKRKQVDDYLKKKIEAESAGQSMAAEMIQMEIDKIVTAYRRGFVQGLHWAFRCPSIVMAALANKAGGVVPEVFLREYLPNLRATDVKDLFNAHKKDMEILENAKPVYHVDRPGPAFTAKWNALCEADKADVAKAGTEDKRPKAQSSEKIMEQVNDGKLKSKLACELSSLHAGKSKDEGVSIPSLDAEAYMLDLIKGYDMPLFEMIKEEAGKIEKKILESDKAKTVEAPVEAEAQ